MRINDFYNELNSIVHNNQKVAVSFQEFTENTQLPYISYHVSDESTLEADNIVYGKWKQVIIEVFTEDYDEDLEEKVEGILEKLELSYDPSYNYLPMKNIVIKTYEISLL